MRLDEVQLGRGGAIRRPSPGRCIYCYRDDVDLRDEHVIPFALGANSLVLEKSCCAECQAIIQPYEQEVLKKQIGRFRAQVGAPSRTRQNNRDTHADFKVYEIDENGAAIRELGVWSVPIEEAPLVLNLWTSPPPRRLRSGASLTRQAEAGSPWTFVKQDEIDAFRTRIAMESGVENFAIHLGNVNRTHYCRSIAKTAHAFAVSELGLDSFDPFLLDLILCRSDDVCEFVGDDYLAAPENAATKDQTVSILLGESMGGPEAGLLCARFSLYPYLGSPAHIIVVGKARVDIAETVAERHSPSP